MRVIDRETFDRTVVSSADENALRKLKEIAANEELEQNPPQSVEELFDFYRRTKTPATLQEVRMNGCRQTEERWVSFYERNLAIVQEVVGDDLQRLMQLQENPVDRRKYLQKIGGLIGYYRKKHFCHPLLNRKYGGMYGGIVCYCDERPTEA